MSRLIKLLDRPIAYNPAFAKLKAGKVRSGPVAAVFLSQLVYWHNRMDGGWMYKTQSDISAETALTRDEQETARKRLVALGVLEEKLRGIPAIMHYRINTERLEALLIEQVKPDTKADSNESRAANIKNVGTPQSDAGQYREQVCGNTANCDVEISQTVMRGSRKPSWETPQTFIQEITQRILKRLLMRLQTLLAHPLTRLHQRVLPDRNIHRNLNRPGRKTPNVLVASPSRQPSKPGKPASGRE